jgi:MipA family protein
MPSFSVGFQRLFTVISVMLMWDYADAKPRVEMGLALLGQYGADYRGSSHYQPDALLLPYFLYQGPIVKIGRDGVRGEFWANERFEFDLSADGSLSSRSDNNKLRSGMPELDSAFELGPSLNVRLTGKNFQEGWSLRFPLRAVFTLSSGGVDYIGYLFNPRVSWRKPNALWGWRASVNFGVLIADKTYHQYYYDVEPQFVTDVRPYYLADGGYSGAFTRVTFSKKIDQWRYGISMRYDNLAGVNFIDSPLVETKHSASLSFGVMRTLWMN